MDIPPPSPVPPIRPRGPDRAGAAYFFSSVIATRKGAHLPPFDTKSMVATFLSGCGLVQTTEKRRIFLSFWSDASFEPLQATLARFRSFFPFQSHQSRRSSP